jgi:hypothetical protein
MSQDENPKSDETVVRVLLRVPDEMSATRGRPHMDADDFVRSLSYGPSRLPENGLSLLRKDKFRTSQDIYEYIRSKKLMGIAECKFEQLISKHLEYRVTGVRHEHISLRCPGCDLSEQGLNRVCKPTGEVDFETCPFFQPDLFDLISIFRETEGPAPRHVGEKR